VVAHCQCNGRRMKPGCHEIARWAPSRTWRLKYFPFTRAKMEPLRRFYGLVPASQGHNPVLTVVYVPYSLVSCRSPRACPVPCVHTNQQLKGGLVKWNFRNITESATIYAVLNLGCLPQISYPPVSSALEAFRCTADSVMLRNEIEWRVAGAAG